MVCLVVEAGSSQCSLCGMSSSLAAAVDTLDEIIIKLRLQLTVLQQEQEQQQNSRTTADNNNNGDSNSRRRRHLEVDWFLYHTTWRIVKTVIRDMVAVFMALVFVSGWIMILIILTRYVRIAMMMMMAATAAVAMVAEEEEL